MNCYTFHWNFERMTIAVHNQKSVSNSQFYFRFGIVQHLCDKFQSFHLFTLLRTSYACLLLLFFLISNELKLTFTHMFSLYFLVRVQFVWCYSFAADVVYLFNFFVALCDFPFILSFTKHLSRWEAWFGRQNRPYHVLYSDFFVSLKSTKNVHQHKCNGSREIMCMCVVRRILLMQPVETINL